MKKKLKVYFLTTTNSGVAFYRQYQFKEEMNKQGLADAVMPWFNFEGRAAHENQPWQMEVQDPYVSGNRGFLAYRVSQADVVVVQRVVTWEALCLLEALKAAYPNTVFLTEIDDYILDTPTYNNAFRDYGPGSPFRQIVVEQLRALDGVIVSTPFLADAYRDFNKHVYVVPNSINFDWWDQAAGLYKEHPKEIRIGWVGGADHREDLASIEKPIKALLKKRQNVWFYCIHGAPDFFKDQSRIVTPRSWEFLNRYHKKLAKYSLDIGIAPLVDNSFNRAKSNLRKLEYAGLGIPVVAANVGEFARTVKHGKDGFLYSDAEGFTKGLEALIEDKKLRRLMGKYNNLDVRQNFNVAKVAKDYTDILHECHERGQTSTVDVSPRQRPGANQWTEGQPVVTSL